MRKNWVLKSKDPKLQRELSAPLTISPVTAQILINRGIKDSQTASAFLSAGLEDLHDPFVLKGMNKAISRVKKAIDSNENILVCGDYDVDGLTATALLVLVLEQMGASVASYIPNRLEEGYGLSEKTPQICQNQKISVVITVDCGISAYDVAKELTQQGVDLIVTDHHQPSKDTLPDAYSIICPLQKGCPYPYKSLAGVGIAFKFAQALFDGNWKPIVGHLDLAALGTVSDVVPLTGENRILVKHGLKMLTRTKKKGLKALMDVSGISKKEMTTRYVGYILGPRINAQGRLGSPERALKLLLTESADEANSLARILNEDNRTRQNIESNTLKQALAKVEREVDFSRDKVIVLSDENWHPGVIGIVASRLVDRFYRPAIMISTDQEIAKGSGRSIDNFDLFEALSFCRHYLEGFGGHEAACGLTIREDKIGEFREKFNNFASDKLMSADLSPSINIDAEVSLQDLSHSFLEEMESLEPFGEGNEKPVFLIKNLKTKGQSIAVKRNGLKFFVTDGKTSQDVITFDPEYGSYISELGEIDLVFTPEVDNWMGRKTMSLKFIDGRKRAKSDLFSQ